MTGCLCALSTLCLRKLNGACSLDYIEPAVWGPDGFWMWDPGAGARVCDLGRCMPVCRTRRRVAQNRKAVPGCQEHRTGCIDPCGSLPG
jgi:hypothetical protein